MFSQSRYGVCISNTNSAIVPPKTVNEAAKGAHQALRRFRDAQRGGVVGLSRKNKVLIQLPLVSPSNANDDLIRPEDESDWPGGVQQRFRALRPLIENSLLEGYRVKSFGMLDDPRDGVGVWILEFGTGSRATVVANVTNATFQSFADLCSGKFGNSILEDDHLLIAVNPSWTTSADIGQFWDFSLKKQAAALVDNPNDWETIYHFEDIRTAAGTRGVLFRSYPDDWKLYSLAKNDEKLSYFERKIFSRDPIRCPDTPILESAEKPPRLSIVTALNEKKM